MIDGAFVIDAVAHGYNWTPENATDLRRQQRFVDQLYYLTADAVPKPWILDSEEERGRRDVLRRGGAPERDPVEVGLAHSGTSISGRTSGVSVRPGDTAFTRIACSPSSSAPHWLSIATPAFDAQ